MPEMAYVRLEDGFRMYLSMIDVAGPSFDLAYDKRKAFYQYEKKDKDLIEGSLADARVFLDIGANIGHFGFYYKRKFPKLVCHLFEPIPWLESCIKKTIQDNHLTNIYHHPVVIGEKNGDVSLFVDTFNDGGHSIIRENISHRSREGKYLKISSRTLDSFDFDCIDFIKVDIQGAEKKFVKGAVKTLEKFRPDMLIEVANSRIILFVDFLEYETGLSYDVFLADEDEPLSRFNLKEKCLEMEKSGVVERNYLFKVKNRI